MNIALFYECRRLCEPEWYFRDAATPVRSPGVSRHELVGGRSTCPSDSQRTTAIEGGGANRPCVETPATNIEREHGGTSNAMSSVSQGTEVHARTAYMWFGVNEIGPTAIGDTEGCP